MTALACLLAALLVLPSAATPPSGAAAPPTRSAPAAAARPDSVPPAAYGDMHWRLVGPYRAGWATVAEGVPGKPNTFYFGSAGGGVWKTTDAGRTWRGLMQHQRASSIGALAIAPSNPDVIYAGTGQPTIRYDAMAGNGVYRSDDGGRTWKHVGLDPTRHIGRILVDPHDPDRVLVGALGHEFGPNPERGIYLTTDGGRSWKQVLKVDQNTGVVDLARDPEHPAVVYAAAWQMRLHPYLDYFIPQAGPGSGIYKSEDGGETWTRLAGAGLPKGPLGRIGLGVPRGSGGQRVYATVIDPGGGTGFYRSDDGGQSWKLLNDDPELASDYFSRVTVAPNDPDVVYVMGRSIHRSDDGGAHFTIFKGSPGGDDYHFMWIDPSAPDHMISGADQGAAVTVNGGGSWSSWYNQPTGQFYHVAADQRFPYRIYSGQQDNGTVEIASRGPYGVIELRDWHPVGGDERDYMVPRPGDPDLVFGSGLGGHVSRFDEVTRQVAEVSPWPVSSYGARPTDVKYRYTWISPLEFSPVDTAMYFGAQVLFRSTDDGDHWKVVSPDLSGKVTGAGAPSAKACREPDLATARACGFGVIYTIAPSPTSASTIWVGTDDGLIQVTRDGGAHWTDVTPKQIPAWGRVNAIALSRTDRDVAYAAVDLHRIDRYEPLLLKTTDGGRSWSRIDAGIPRDEFTTVVRADPDRAGLLYAGTDRGLYVSFDDGARWQSLSLDFPTTWVRDLLVHDGDLVAATQGRGIWILDDVAPLRQAGDALASEPARLFEPPAALRVRADENRDTPWPPSTPLGQNPPSGAILDYWLGGAASGPVTLTIRDDAGRVVRRFSSADTTEDLPANRYFQTGWLGPDGKRVTAGTPYGGRPLSARAGMHRFVWDLRYPRPKALGYSYSISAVWREGEPLDPEAPLVLPGRYTATLHADGKDYTRPLTVKLDPRVHVTAAALREQLSLALAVDSALDRAVSTYREVEAALRTGGTSLPADRADSLRALADSGDPSLRSVAGVLTEVAGRVQGADAAPASGLRDVLDAYRKDLDGLVRRWERLEGARR
jgi:photosystem II stability/assembly factor-like uncharacterized protein